MVLEASATLAQRPEGSSHMCGWSAVALSLNYRACKSLLMRRHRRLWLRGRWTLDC